MAAGHVDRSVLSSFYQQPGDVYDDTKTEGAFETIAQKVDDNYDYTFGLVDGTLLTDLNTVNLADTATGDGTTNDYTALNNLLTLIGATEKTIIISKPFRIGTSITIPSNVSLWFLRGGSLKPDASITITINGKLEAGLYQIFTGEGTIVNGASKIAGVRPEWWGAFADSVTDCTAAIQAAFNFSRTIFFALGGYLISDTIREATSGGQRRLIGEGEFNSVIMAADSMTGKPMFWFGNSTGHGNYRGKVENLGFDGNDNTNIGIRWHECGTSIISECYFINCATAVQALGCIGSTVKDCYIQSCTNGVLFTAIPTGTPSSVDDITVTASPLTLHTNISKINNIWFSNIVDESIRIEGGLFKVTGCTLQSCGSNGTSNNIRIASGNEHFDYGGGSIIEGNWMEGGDYLYGIYSSSTRAVRIRDNFFGGSNSGDGSIEGGILLENSDNAVVEGNSFRGHFNRTPAGGRLANAAIYITANSRAYSCKLEDNYFTKTFGCTIYLEEAVMPAIIKKQRPEWATIAISAGVATINASSSAFISSVTRAATGSWVINYAFAREAITTGQYPIIVTPYSGNIAVGYAATLYQFTATNDRVHFINNSNVKEDPAGFTIYMFGDYTGA